MQIFLIPMLWMWAGGAAAFYAELERAEKHYQTNIGFGWRVFSAAFWPVLFALMLSRAMARRLVRDSRDEQLKKNAKAATE